MGLKVLSEGLAVEPVVLTLEESIPIDSLDKPDIEAD